MKKYKIVKLLLCTFFLSSAKSPGQELSGHIKDKNTGESLPGSIVYFPDLKTGSIADSAGNYKIVNLPEGEFVLQVKMLGYSTISRAVNLLTTKLLNFELEPSSVEKPEVIISGSVFTTDSKRTSTPVTQMDISPIRLSGSGSLIGALAAQPGINEVSTGAGISKPVIRGLSSNRVVVVDEGIRQEDQQWGDEHGIEIDPFSADKIEILKGPASLLYGSDALGGVINILEPIPPPPGVIQGEIVTGISTNNRMGTASGMLEGNRNGLIWRGRVTYRNAASFRTPVERVFNSGFHNFSNELTIGLNRTWGFSHLHYSRFDSWFGITEGNRDTVSGKLLDTSGNIPAESELNTRNLVLPYQHIIHNKISSISNFIIGRSQLKVNWGWQGDNRREYEQFKDKPGLWMSLNTLTYDIKYYPASHYGIATAFGISGMHQDNKNLGIEFLIPDYLMNDAGVFGTFNKSWKKTTINAGVRIDTRQIEGKEKWDAGTRLFMVIHPRYYAVSGSMGFTIQLNDRINLKANAGRGFRAPNISELASNGVHEGTFRYELGNPGLLPETSFQFDAGAGYDHDNLSLTLDLFYNRIDNYIYYRNLNQSQIQFDGKNYPLFTYVQGLSVLTGGEFSSDFHPVKRLHFENSVSYVYAQNADLRMPLPFIPPFKMVNELKYLLNGKNKGYFQNSFISLIAETNFRQNRVDLFETTTAGYTLFGVKSGTEFKIHGKKGTIFINASNIFNKIFFNNLSRLKEAGINGTGRLISFGLQIPFSTKI